MGNICTNHEEKIIHLENRLEEQQNLMNELSNQNKLLQRDNIYLKRRLNREQRNILIR